ncbi:MAG: hypothetical protein ACK40X_04400 [Armatimonadota bacterium]
MTGFFSKSEKAERKGLNSRLPSLQNRQLALRKMSDVRALFQVKEVWKGRGNPA